MKKTKPPPAYSAPDLTGEAFPTQSTEVQTKLQKRAFWAALILLLFAVAYVLKPFWKTIVLSIVFSILFLPVHRKIQSFFPNKKNIPALLSILVVLVTIIIPLGVLLTLVTSQLVPFVRQIPVSFSSGEMSSLINEWKVYLDPWISRLEGLLGSRFDLFGVLRNTGQYLAQYLAEFSPSVIFKTFDITFNLFILLVLLFYLFRDGEIFFQKLIKLSPMKDQYERRLAHEIQSTIYSVFFGSFLTALIQAILATIGYAIAGVEGFLVWGVMTFFLAFIPFVGTAGIILPLVIILIAQGHTGSAIFLAIYGLAIIGSADNFLKPFLISGNVHQALLFLSLFGGLTVFGALGLVLGPILMALLVATVNIYEKDFLEETPPPSAS